VSAQNASPDRSLLLSAAVVAASTLVFPWVGGYGTVLFQVVTLNAWGVLAGLTSGRYADFHHGLLWTLALLVNAFLFLIPALPWRFFTRHHR
jgi:hypothetical protein